MATASKLSSSMQLKYSAGVDSGGKEVFKRKTFKNLKPAVLDDDIYALSQQMGAVQENPVAEVKRIDESSIQA